MDQTETDPTTHPENILSNFKLNFNVNECATKILRACSSPEQQVGSFSGSIELIFV
jgi:hypothetical protein